MCCCIIDDQLDALAAGRLPPCSPRSKADQLLWYVAVSILKLRTLETITHVRCFSHDQVSFFTGYGLIAAMLSHFPTDSAQTLLSSAAVVASIRTPGLFFAKRGEACVQIAMELSRLGHSMQPGPIQTSVYASHDAQME